jgi:hypothetical protein
LLPRPAPEGGDGIFRGAEGICGTVGKPSAVAAIDAGRLGEATGSGMVGRPSARPGAPERSMAGLALLAGDVGTRLISTAGGAELLAGGVVRPAGARPGLDA